MEVIGLKFTVWLKACFVGGLHLLKGQQLALVDLLEPIRDGGVELRLRAFLPLEHAHGGRVVVVVVVVVVEVVEMVVVMVVVGTEVRSPGMCCRRLRLSGRCLARL